MIVFTCLYYNKHCLRMFSQRSLDHFNRSKKEEKMEVMMVIMMTSLVFCFNKGDNYCRRKYVRNWGFYSDLKGNNSIILKSRLMY